MNNFGIFGNFFPNDFFLMISTEFKEYIDKAIDDSKGMNIPVEFLNPDLNNKEAGGGSGK